MKIVLMALVVVGAYFLYEFTVGDVFRKYQGCYDTASVQVTALSGNNVDISDSNVCVSEKLIYDDMKVCVSEIQQQSNFTSFLYQASKAQESIDSDIKIHNEACPTNKVEAPKDSFYLSASGSSR